MYLDNKRFTENILAAQSGSPMSEELGEQLILICRKCVYMRAARSYVRDEDELFSACIMRAMSAVYSFHPFGGTAFNFFTTVCMNCINEEDRKAQRFQKCAVKGYGNHLIQCEGIPQAEW